MSIHRHLNKIETFHVLKGKIELKYCDNVERAEATKGVGMWSIVLDQNDTFFIPQGRVHQIIALVDSEILEVSTHDDPEDSIRIVKGD
jgi:quercetin dioxygenase-like cupin family protein